MVMNFSTSCVDLEKSKKIEAVDFSENSSVLTYHAFLTNHRTNYSKAEKETEQIKFKTQY